MDTFAAGPPFIPLPSKGFPSQASRLFGGAPEFVFSSSAEHVFFHRMPHKNNCGFCSGAGDMYEISSQRTNL